VTAKPGAIAAETRATLEIDESGDVVTLDGEMIIHKRYGYDSEDADVVAQMVKAYNQAGA